jgi:hypothetical protein
MSSAHSARLPAFLVVMLCAHTSFAQQPPIGFVLKLDGVWLVDGQPLGIGQQVRAGATLRLSPASPVGAARSFLIILANSQPFPALCLTEQACRAGITLPASLNESASLLSRIADAFNLIFKEPNRYVSALSRGEPGGGARVPDGVVRLQAGALDLAPLFQNIGSGTFVMRLRSLPHANGPSRTTTITVNAAQSKSPVAAAGLLPGLYEVSLMTAPDADTASDTSWWLLDAPPHYDISRAAFDETAKVIASWGELASNRDKQLLLRACLDQIASQIR